jgi:predicted nucleotidyltransferase component of viral defense system
MIDLKSISKEWIEETASSHKVDRILAEKVIRALILLEGLCESDLPFIFKGGTALMLMLNSTKRLSIDIDIILSDKDADWDIVLTKICKDKEFARYEKQERMAATKIDKIHYQLFFHSEIQNGESAVLLDILCEKIHYQNIIEIPVESFFIHQKSRPVKVKVPDFNDILGDKLTAFAPNTTGIPYQKKNKDMGMEIIKQMYDIGCLYDKVDSPTIVSKVFNAFAKTELAYRGNLFSVEDVLNDIIDTALSVCLRQNQGNANFDVLGRGIIRIKSFIFSELFHLEKAIAYAAKTACLAAIVKYGKNEIIRYAPEAAVTGLFVSAPMNTKLNKLKKVNREAFFYLYQVSEMMRG